MKKDLVFLQNLQDSYANWTGLAVIICSLEGDFLTEISWGNRLTEELYREYLTKENLKTFIQPLQSINNTTLLDTELGSKVIISPVKSNGKGNYFIISGFIVDKKTIDMFDKYFKMNAGLSKIEFDLLSDSEIIKKAESIKNMTEVIASYVSLYEDHSNSQTFSTLISEQIDSINNRTSTVDSILQIGNFFESVDFMGLALHSAGDLFTVETSIGRYSNALKGYTFTVGEGLLGYSIATKRPEFYRNVENDARLWAFLKINVNVISLFCFPLIRGDKVIGLLFGGSTEHEIDKMSVYDKLSISASLMVNHLNTQNLVLKNKNQLIEISAFEEIIKVLTTVKDLEKVLFILIDISMNFTRGVLTSIVYRNNPTGNQAKLLSRGADETVCNYLHEAAQKFFSPSPNFEMKKWDGPLISKTPCGTSVMELPLVFDDNVYGLLSVGISSGTDMEKCKTVLSGLATAGGIAIHFLRLGDKVRGELNFIELLRKLLLTYEPEKYELAKNIKETTLEFAQKVGINDSISIEKLSLFSVIDRSLVESIIDDQELFLLLGKFERVLDGKSNGNLIAEITALAWTYYSTNKSLKSIAELKIENKEIHEQFISFINQREVIVTEIMITEKAENTRGISTKIQEEKFHNLNLSAREKEVLNHVIQGCSNKEIAQLLHISDHTVKNHMTHILSKLNVSDRSQAIAKMYQMGYNFTK